MGSRSHNFYNRLACRMGFEADATRVQDLYLDRRHREAMAAVPLEFIDQTSLVGPVERVTERLKLFAEAGVTTLSVTTFEPDLDRRRNVLRKLAEALDKAGVGD
jgi:alkanesulfonate monooxygenase SsuD/methylene tetrahydromethanopterin reductase-like flavin-dependent oxidoreductase (luciferase family)